MQIKKITKISAIRNESNASEKNEAENTQWFRARKAF